LLALGGLHFFSAAACFFSAAAACELLRAFSKRQQGEEQESKRVAVCEQGGAWVVGTAFCCNKGCICTG
jgi:hypothetical protein